jgi:hypothetical protein
MNSNSWSFQDGIPDCVDACWGTEPIASNCPRSFTIQLEKMTDLGVSKYDYAFNRAARTWESILCEDLTVEPFLLDPLLDPYNGEFDSPGTVHAVDDLVVGYGYKDLGACTSGCTAGSGGPIYTLSGKARTGVMVINSQYVTKLEDYHNGDAAKVGNDLHDVIVHEIGHALGLVPADPPAADASCQTSCTVGGGHVDYDGCTPSISFAQAAFEAYYTGASPPRLLIEGLTGSGGSDCAHWAESQLGLEIMTPIDNSNSRAELTSITAGALLDLGYMPSKLSDPSQIGCLMPWSGAPARRMQQSSDEFSYTVDNLSGEIDAGKVAEAAVVQGAPLAVLLFPSNAL